MLNPSKFKSFVIETIITQDLQAKFLFENKIENVNSLLIELVSILA